MKKFLVGCVALGLIATAQGAIAADLSVAPLYKAPPAVVTQAYNWTGFYIGINGGGGFGRSAWDTTGSFNTSGGLVGCTVGYNYQVGQAVFGVEGDIDWADAATDSPRHDGLSPFGERVVRITQLGTYACREMAAYRGWVSEHAYANAIDVESFVLESGKRVSVLSSFERGDETRTRAGAFLRAVSHRAYDEAIFSNVLTPYFDERHRNHFHLDLARYRNDGARPMAGEP